MQQLSFELFHLRRAGSHARRLGFGGEQHLFDGLFGKLQFRTGPTPLVAGHVSLIEGNSQVMGQSRFCANVTDWGRFTGCSINRRKPSRTIKPRSINSSS
ncbi:MAG: hypothetical protein ACR2I2_12935 [Bryobacteraceae bacterium]